MRPRPLAIASLLFTTIGCAWAANARLTGRLTDTQDMPVSGGKLRLRTSSGQTAMEATSDAAGEFVFATVPPGEYELSATSPGFTETKNAVHIGEDQGDTVDLHFTNLATRTDTVTVAADVRDVDVQAPEQLRPVRFRCLQGGLGTLNDAERSARLDFGPTHP